MRAHHVVICSCVQEYQIFIDSLYEMGKRDLLRFKLRVHTAQTSISGAPPMNYVGEKKRMEYKSYQKIVSQAI